jgi:hypothetical protein
MRMIERKTFVYIQACNHNVDSHDCYTTVYSAASPATRSSHLLADDDRPFVNIRQVTPPVATDTGEGMRVALNQSMAASSEMLPLCNLA